MSDEVTAEFRAAVSQHTGVPVELLHGGMAAEVWESARRAADWKAATDSQPAAAPSIRPITPQPVPTDPVAVMSAYRQGRLADRGAPAPPPRPPQSTRSRSW